MAKKATIARTSRSRKRAVPDQIISAQEALQQIKPASVKAAQVVSLLSSWLADESGYDEETWPQLKKALDEERGRVTAPRLYHG